MAKRKPTPLDFSDVERHPDNWPMVLTPRDRRILQHIHTFDGFLADYQVQRLEFTGMRQCQDRLAKLFHNGFLNRTNRRGRTSFDSMIYWLTSEGAEIVAGGSNQDWSDFRWQKQLRPDLIEHNRLVNDFSLDVLEAIGLAPDLSLYLMVNESVFRSDSDRVTFQTQTGKRAQRNIIPDRFFIIEREDEPKPFRSRLLLELDLATHPNNRFADQKILPGIAYLHSDAYLQRFGSNSGRWLVVTTSLRRLAYLKETAERAAGRDSMLWYFTTFEQVSAESVLTAPIWLPGGKEAPIALFPSLRGE